MDQIPPVIPNPIPVAAAPIKKGGGKWSFLIVGGIIILASIVVGAFFLGNLNIFKLKPAAILPQTISPNILYLTQPVFNFSGIVEQIDGDTLTVSDDMALSPATRLAENTSADEIPISKKISYKVQITPDTKIHLAEISVPYSFNAATPSATPKITINDLKVGQRVEVVSKSDLRVIGADRFEAVSITASLGTTVIGGTVLSISGNILSVKATPPSVPEPKDYSIAVNNETEVTASAPILQKLALTDLKKGIQVLVYTDTDINSQSPRALKIEVLPDASVATSSASQR